MRLLAIISSALLVPATSSAAAPDFDKDVVAVLGARCLDCHSGADPKGGLDLTRKDAVLGKSGSVTPGKPDASELWKRVASDEMPPKKPLSAQEKAVLKEWIASGAKWGTDPIDPFAASTANRAGRDWWSLRPVTRPKVPDAPGAKTPVPNTIDRFVLAKLRDNGMSLAPPADRRALIRRAYFDLLGIPPTYEETEAFANDKAPNAYERLIDKLLASEHYGERWGRYWLDVARFAETCGYERDQVKPDVWKYRDWVIKAFNTDMPYDRFVQEQLAGDELPNANANTTVATGFIRLGTWNDEPNDPNEYKYDRLEDMVGATSTAFLGMTVKCARCHDHKFDAIRQTDYYRMAGVFWAGFIEPGPREHLGGPDAKALGHNGVFGWTDRGKDVPPIKLLKKGDPNRPGAVVEPGHLSMIAALDKPLTVPPAGASTTTRRLQLAQWITNPQNPLTARVWVNRVWQYHFGQGLVRTPDNFGFTGDKPTHSELLDWLASEFVQGGYTTKRLHRLIMLSDTYRQSSIHPKQDEYARRDAGNKFWWHAERRRLDAEALRDTLLFAGGNLKLDKIGGPSFAPEIPPDALEGLSMKGNAWKASPAAEQGRRSVYIFAKRGLLPPLLTTFDLPDTTLPSCQRDVTTVPTQSLALLNNPFVHEQSAALAKRIGIKKESKEQVICVWRSALGRDPRDAEVAAALVHLEKQAKTFASRPDPALDALASLCHVLLNTNEFMYVD
ncbi:PSD1 domain-containing protein [Gemmata sp. G18]|uniref:PSD1 domain-containing protein n=1 Tax=Gemmata palustris TaxID=2822762 RepID=A0ABS5C426_9BACT|nr:PSD1 and planctomycete cytochrome C domain-containing protein [Gemmata palustris]MBP3960741.1 PSD1 domain-containing protein [Gemmata palustris]